MSAYYYLVSSLPMLMPQTSPPLTFTEFENACTAQLSRADLRLLDATGLLPEEHQPPPHSVAAGWNDWEAVLRNQIAVARSARANGATEQFPESGCYPEITQLTREALAIENPLERERFLDQARWSRLDELEAGHHFDLDALCIYKLKLLLLEKWLPRQPEQGAENFDNIVKSIVATQDENQPASR